MHLTFRVLGLLLVALFIEVKCSIAQNEVAIGSQVWMSKNLDIDKFRNGDSIPQITSWDERRLMDERKQPFWCYYGFKKSDEEGLGKYYNYYALSDLRGISPFGWHVATLDEWMTLAISMVPASWGVPQINIMKENMRKYHDWRFCDRESGSKRCLEVGPLKVKETKIRTIGGYEETEWVVCDNCSYWTDNQKKNNPCTVCRNKRGWLKKTGRFVEERDESYEVVRDLGWNGKNPIGFSATPVGGWFFDDYNWHDRKDWFYSRLDESNKEKQQAIWWTNSQSSKGPIWITLYQEGQYSNFRYDDNQDKSFLFQVRCVKD